MSWTCPHCSETIEEPESGSIRFCLHCGEPSESEPMDSSAARLDRLLRVVMVFFGLSWLVWFFIPFGRASFGLVMSWDLLANREGLAYLVSWPLMLGLLILVLGAVAPFPGWLRSGTAAILGTAFLIIMGVEEPGGPLGRDISFAFVGGGVWILMFPVVGAGLLLRTRVARSVTARVLIGISILFGLVAYLTSAEGQTTLVGALLRYLGEGEAVQAISRILILLPLFLLLAATVAFRMPNGKDDPAAKWVSILSWIWLLYLPVFLLIHGLMLWVSEGSGYYFLMFFRLAFYLGGIIAVLMLSASWLAGYIPARLIPLLKRNT
ncbi:MAG: hypothetical protein JRJ87_02045 [Deltaproteobacteria bacterium]|nr:hypothetical protein [Deltaproteobacteria bacterium]